MITSYDTYTVESNGWGQSSEEVILDSSWPLQPVVCTHHQPAGKKCVALLADQLNSQPILCDKNGWRCIMHTWYISWPVIFVDGTVDVWKQLCSFQGTFGRKKVKFVHHHQKDTGNACMGFWLGRLPSLPAPEVLTMTPSESYRKYAVWRRITGTDTDAWHA